MTVVIDSNILIAFALADEPLHTKANQVLENWQKTGEILSAPCLLKSELTAVVRKVVYQQRMTSEQGHKLLEQLLLYPISLYEDDALLKDAYTLAVQFNRPRAYDTQYIALAQRLGCAFWTADERLVNSVKSVNHKIFWLGDWPLKNI